MKMAAIACAAMIAATGANALSCMRPDVASSFVWANESEDTYVVLLGSLDVPVSDRQVLRPRMQGADPNPEDTRIRVGFSGEALGASGFGPTALSEVILVLQCLGPWCGSIRGNQRIMTFAKQTDEGYVVTVDPCYGSVFTDPSAEDVAQVEACMRGEACEARQLRR